MSNDSQARRPGRPRRHQEPRRDIHISLSERVIQALDVAAANEGRTAYIERLLKDALGIQDGTTKQLTFPDSN